VLARFAEAVQPGPRLPLDRARTELQALVLRRLQLIEMLKAEKNRLRLAPVLLRWGAESSDDQIVVIRF
jgi:hypothetical protein